MAMSTITIGRGGGILHINRQFIAMNQKDGRKRPVFTLKPDGAASSPIYARGVFFNGPAEAVAPDTPLPCGARAWLSLYPGIAVEIEDAMTFDEAKAQP